MQWPWMDANKDVKMGEALTHPVCLSDVVRAHPQILVSKHEHVVNGLLANSFVARN